MTRVSLSLSLIISLSLCLILTPAPLPAQTMTLTPASGPTGTTVTLSGTMDFPNTPFTVHWNTRDGPILVEGKTGGATPLSFSVTFTIPEDYYGRHSIYIVPLGQQDAVTAPPFSITPTLSLSPATVTPGGTITVTGKGFATQDTAQITFDGTIIKDSISVNPSGSFTTSVTVPDATAGSHTVRASSIIVPAQEVAPLTITINPVITASPIPAEVSKPITLTGKGFGGERTMTLKHSDNIITTDPSPLKTNSAGTFTATFTLPLGTTLKPALTATDTAGNKATLDLTLFLERVPPPSPAPIAPTGRVNWFGSSSVTFTWTKVTDPSGVSYILEIAKDLAFFPPYLKRAGVIEEKYISEDKLPPGTYYWRVKTLDGAGNESQWVTAPHPFKVGFFPLWSLPLAGAVGAFLTLWLVIRLILGFYRWLRSMLYY